jgi:hypothetical protein
VRRGAESFWEGVEDPATRLSRGRSCHHLT